MHESTVTRSRTRTQAKSVELRTLQPGDHFVTPLLHRLGVVLGHEGDGVAVRRTAGNGSSFTERVVLIGSALVIPVEMYRQYHRPRSRKTRPAEITSHVLHKPKVRGGQEAAR